MNSFCIFCQGGQRKKDVIAIKHCEFRDCPFYRDKYADIDHEDEREIAVKLLGEIGITK